MTDEAARVAQRARAERHRDRKRDGRTLVSIEVTWRQRQALLRLGLIAPGNEGDGEAAVGGIPLSGGGRERGDDGAGALPQHRGVLSSGGG
jgi:hypothetical protein